jgi:EAL domain-containing protein (putative c-di-GMP-specific phosphodiesterase class I)
MVGGRQQLEWELRRALERGGELELVYQPIYAAWSLAISGVEALVRWNHPKLGLLSPVSFIPIAEETGLINELGAWVLREACETARRWPLDTIAVNVSPTQCRRPDFAGEVLSILRESGMPPSRLELEITENALLDSDAESHRTLEAVRRAGVRIALDDFGTGYSSLSYLQKIEVDRIKIDRSFVQNLGEGSSSFMIVEAVVALAHALDIHVTAEGVETARQQQFLTQIGCNDLQGFLFSGSLSRAALDALFKGGGDRASHLPLKRAVGA